ncbi:MAG: hypothetical protein WDZ79_01680 [Candidatus Paceibacterota bacterium]
MSNSFESPDAKIPESTPGGSGEFESKIRQTSDEYLKAFDARRTEQIAEMEHDARFEMHGKLQEVIDLSDEIVCATIPDCIAAERISDEAEGESEGKQISRVDYRKLEMLKMAVEVERARVRYAERIAALQYRYPVVADGFRKRHPDIDVLYKIGEDTFRNIDTHKKAA